MWRNLLTASAMACAASMGAIGAEAAEWDGAYAGISIARGTGTTTWSPAGVADFKTSPQGAFGGIAAGYNWQNGSILAGLEADYNFGKFKVNGSGPDPTAIYTSSVNGLGSVRGRLGWVAAPSLLIYATGGIGWGSTSLAAANATTSFSSSRTTSGLVLGGGLEYKMSKNWALKGEYLNYRLGSTDLSNADTGGNGAVSYKNNVNLFKLGLNYKF